MGAAHFILIINLCVAAIFAISFGVLAAYQKRTDAALWLAAAYGLGVINVLLEFVLPLQLDPRPVGIAIFLDFLIALVLMTMALARHYRVAPPVRTLAVLIAASVLCIILIIGMPRDSFVRMVLYQAPYAVALAIGIGVVAQARPLRPLDWLLMGIMALSALQFLAKPLVAVVIGSGSRPQDYIASTYAAISQTAGGILLIATGLLLLLILVRDVMEEMTARSETDRLSGLLNRRGFEERAVPALANLRRSGLPGAIVIADLDHFKQVNDQFGHEAGDTVIAGFARILSQAAGTYFVPARLGGEEFVVFMPGVEAAGARLFAESVRQAFSRERLEAIPTQPTASFGVAQIEIEDSLADAIRRADGALYDAKREGRDRVRVAPRETDSMPDAPFRAQAGRFS